MLNHFIDIYRIITQDPYVRRINEQLDTYLIDYSVGTIPQKYKADSPDGILRNIQDIEFSREIGKGRQLKYRLNTLEDLFPGKILEETYFDLFSRVVKKPYEVPLHYELIFSAQFELKRRNYHIAILEAETAFEVYIANSLLEASGALGVAKNQVLADMEKPRKLGLLFHRMSKLDSVVAEYRRARGLPVKKLFVNSATYIEWKNHLYKIRNRIVHEGWRLATFDLAKRGIAACKVAIKELEDRLPDIANPIQIYPGVDHLQNTAGRLKF